MSHAASSVSAKEARQWASLGTTLVIYGIFAGATWSGAVQGSEQVRLLITLVIAQVVTMIGFAIVLAIRNGNQRPDERDRLIEMRSYRSAYFVLASGAMWCGVVYLLWAAGAGQPEAARTGFHPPSVMLVGHCLLGCFVAAEVAKVGTQIVLYRWRA